jgi:O-antigen ligase
MSVTAALWVAIAVTSIALTIRRSVYGIVFYMLTFFAAPHLWWWGRDLPSLRYAWIAGFVALVGVVLHLGDKNEGPEFRFTAVQVAALAMGINATFVHFFLASTPSISIDNYIEFLKYIVLFFLIWRATENRSDMRIIIMAIALGSAYIGYEVTINERGYFSGSRLEGVGAPGADSSNSLASVMLLALPLIGSLFIKGDKRHKLTAVLAAPLVLNVVLLCNSRGAFLALIGAGLSFLFIARGPTRKQALRALALGAVALYLLLGDPKILMRFSTTFVGGEDRDRSAASRLEFWQAGLLMLWDYPLGDGGGSFKYVRGGQYLQRVIGDDTDRSLHNGFLSEATEWGVQGLILRLIFIWAAASSAYRAIKRCRLEGNTEDAILGMCLMVSLAGFLITCVFGSFLRNEWGYWIVALLVRYGELYGAPQTSLAASRVPALAAPAGFTPSLSSSARSRL